MHWLLEHFQHMKQALEAFNISNISVDNYWSTTRVSADVLCFYKALSYKHLHSQYKLWNTGVPCPLIEHDNSGVVYG